MQGDRHSRDIESMPGPLSESLWSADFVMQAIEILPVLLRNGRLWSLRPEHADSFVVGWPAGAKPEEVAKQAMVQLGIEPAVLHSTSWRHADKEVVLTYIAIVPPGSVLPPSWKLSIQNSHAAMRLLPHRLSTSGRCWSMRCATWPGSGRMIRQLQGA